MDSSVNDADLIATWRRLVAAWHPDRNATAGASRRMQHINKAYQHIHQLSDGHSDGTDKGGHSETQAEQYSASEAPEPDCHRRTHVSKVRLSLEEAILGCTRTLRGHFARTCDACVGKGQRVLVQVVDDNYLGRLEA